MAQFVSFDPNVEVRSEVLLGWLAGTQQKINPYLKEYGITDVRPGEWHRQQSALDALRLFGQDYPLFNAGLSIPEYAVFPPDLHSLRDALLRLDEAYHMNHRYGEIGRYAARVINERTIDVVAENPYPCEFDFGLLTYLGDRFAPEGVEVKVVHDPNAPCRRSGGQSCTYHVRW